MANRLQFKRGSGAPGNIFYEGEPIYDKSGKILYIGDDASNPGAGSSIGSADAYKATLEMLYKASNSGSGSIRLYEDTDFGTNYVAISAASSLASNYTLTLPDTVGSPNQILQGDGSGNLSWSTMSVNTFTKFAVVGQSTVTADTYDDILTFENGNGIVITTDEPNDKIIIGIDTTGTATFSNINVTGVGTIATLNSTNGTITNLTGTAGTITTFNSTNSTITNGTITNLTGTAGTITTFNSTTGTITNLSGTNLNYSGIGTVGTLDVESLTQNRVVYVGTGGTLTDSSNLTFDGTTFTVGTGVGITQFSSSVSTGTSTSSVPTSSAVIDYVGTQIGAVDLTVSTAEGTNGTGGGGGSFNTSQTLTFAGTTNEVDVTVSGQTVTYGLPSNVTIGNDLTVNGNLRVVGTAVTFETQVVKVEDRIIELGLVDGATDTSTTWDLGVAFNYGDGAAKRSGMFWLDNSIIGIASAISVSNDESTGDTNPQVTVSTYAPVALASLYFGGITSNELAIQKSTIAGYAAQAVSLVFDGGTYP